MAAWSPWVSLWVALRSALEGFLRVGGGRGSRTSPPNTHTLTHSLLHIPVRSCMKGEVIFSYGQYFCLFTGSHAALGKQHRILQRFLFSFFYSLRSCLIYSISPSPLFTSPHPILPPAFLVCYVFPQHKEVRYYCGAGHPPVL